MKEYKDKKLTGKEKQFCCNYINTGNVRESAVRAGYGCEPEKIGARLLMRTDIINKINQLYSEKKKNLRYRACSGYERLAFGSISDAVRLLYIDEPDAKTLESMDLFNISEIKKPKEGAMEIKFFDRLRALEKLEQSDLSERDEASPFYNAFEQGLKAFEKDETDSLGE